MNNRGKAGCGCLIVLLVVFMVAVGLIIHPFTLRVIAKQLRYEDKIFPSDALIVPRFQEDKNGDLYIDAFREYQAGNGKIILIEDDKVFGMSIYDLIVRMAKARGIKETAVVRMETDTEEKARIGKIRQAINKAGFKKVTILVPEYASRRFHILFESSGEDGKAVYMIRAVAMPYFKRDIWWKDAVSRGILAKEFCNIGSYYLEKLKFGGNEKTEKKEK
jgi:hypothetical protein